MNPLSLLFAIIIYVIAFAVAYLIKSKYKTIPTPDRYETIDGLRGVLAFSVFIHHTAIWHQYIQTGDWSSPKSNLYVHFGESSVALFFMITAFLFITKLLNTNSKKNDFNWKKFVSGRIYRLVPLYYFFVFVTIVIVMTIGNWQLHLSRFNFFKSILNWMLFTVYDDPDINASKFTTIIAGVVWSLPFEWLFYFVMPLLGLVILKSSPKTIFIVISVTLVIIFLKIHLLPYYYILAFAGGSIAPFIIRYTSLPGKIKNIYALLIISLCIFLLLKFSSSNNIYSIILLTIIFTIIATGHSVFGIFKNSTLKFLGDISYSTYLLHAPVLFIYFYFVIGLQRLKTCTPAEYCYVTFLIVPFVVAISYAGFRFIESPFIIKSKKEKEFDIPNTIS